MCLNPTWFRHFSREKPFCWVYSLLLINWRMSQKLLDGPFERCHSIFPCDVKSPMEMASCMNPFGESLLNESIPHHLYCSPDHRTPFTPFTDVITHTHQHPIQTNHFKMKFSTLTTHRTSHWIDFNETDEFHSFHRSLLNMTFQWVRWIFLHFQRHQLHDY